MSQRGNPFSHIYESLSFLEEREKESQSITDVAQSMDHILSIKLGTRLLETFLAVSSNGDLKSRIKSMVHNVREELQELSTRSTDGSLILDSSYASLREKMSTVIIKQETGEYDVIFQKLFNWIGSLKKTNDFLLECFGNLSSFKAHLIAALVNEVEELKQKLLCVQALLAYVANTGVHVEGKNKNLLTPLVSVTEKAACLLYSCAIDKMEGKMALAMKHTFSDLLENIKVKEIYVMVLRASELYESKDNVLESEFYLLDILINLLDSLPSSETYVNGLCEQILDTLKFLKMFLADLPREQRLENFNYLSTTIEAITWKSIPVIYSCYNEGMQEERGGEVSGALSELHDQIDNIPAQVREMKLYNYPITDELGFLDCFLGYLSDLMNCQSGLIETLSEEIREIYLEFNVLRSFLYEHSNLQKFRTHIIQLAYQAEHVIDFYLVKYASVSRIKLSLSKIIAQAEHIKLEAAKIWDEEKHYVRAHDTAKTSMDVSSEGTRSSTKAVVGFEDEKRMIMEDLFGDQKQVRVLSIVGMGGIGKTTLLKEIYGNPSIVEFFDVRAWCYVSQTYQEKELLLTILGGITTVSEDINKLNEGELGEKLYQSLKGRRYLLVIDDLWDIKAWNCLKLSLPDENNSSRILITSRLWDVARQIKAFSKVHALCPLSDDESWELLQQKLFLENVSEDFLEVGKQIAKNCKGLPLAIVVIAGVLANMEKSTWNKISESLSSHILSDSGAQCKVILDLSYNQLPDHLKPCFLYFGAFQVDEEILVRKLKLMWIAEGFVRERKEISLEDVAENYLIDLITRNLVIATKERSHGGAKACRMHNLLHEFCFEKAKEENFLQVIRVGHWSKFSSECHQRRVSVHSKADDFMKAKPSGYGVRSLMFASDKEPRFHLDISFIYQNFKLLWVLDLSHVTIGRSFNKIGLLIHLRYLAVNSKTTAIPSTIANLWNLQSLLVFASNGKVVHVPDSIWDMVNLRHVHINLQASFDVHPSRLAGRFLLDNLVSLSTPFFSTKEDAENLLRRLPKLEKLKCEFNFKCYQFPKLDFLTQLMSLKVTFISNEPPQPETRCEFNFPSNLQKLTLSGFPLLWDEVSKIGTVIPNLQVLKLIRVKCSGCWFVDAGCFPKLKYLLLSTVFIDGWIASEGSFSSLEHLVLDKCQGIFETPPYFEHIPTITMKDCGSSLVDSARRFRMEQVELGNEEHRFHINPKQHDKSPLQYPCWDSHIDQKWSSHPPYKNRGLLVPVEQIHSNESIDPTCKAAVNPNLKKLTFELALRNDGDKRKVITMVSKLPGIQSISVDMKDRKLTVIGDLDPVVVVGKLRKYWHIELISAGPETKIPVTYEAETKIPVTYEPVKKIPVSYEAEINRQEPIEYEFVISISLHSLTLD